MDKKPIRIWMGISLAGFLLISGCWNREQRPPEIRLYSLSCRPVRFRADKPLPAVIRLLRPEVDPPYDTKKIVYSTTPYSRSFYRYHLWAAEPGDMVFRIMERDLAASGMAEGIIAPDSGLSATHEIRTAVTAFYERDERDGWYAELSMRISLIELHPEHGTGILLEKTYSAAERLARRNPEGLARAMSKALERISASIVRDVATAIRHSSRMGLRGSTSPAP